MQPGVTPGAVLELHAAKANNGTTPGINSPLTTTWTDTSGNNNNGTLTNFGTQTPWGGTGTTADPYKLSFDGTNDYVGLPFVNLTPSKMFSVELWFEPATTTGIHYVWVERTGSFHNASLRFDGTPGTTLYALLAGIQASKANVGGTGLHQVIMTCDGSTLRLYVDSGTPSATSVSAVGVLPTPTMHYLGSWSGSVQFMQGSTELLRLYPFTLTAAQIQQNYNAGLNW